MKSFIDTLADHINEESYKGNELCIVFPNRRAGLFLKRKLIPTNGKPRWMPQILSIEDFVFSISKLKEVDNVTLLATLYKAHCIINSNPVSFDNFMSWGTEILRDFEEVDQYLSDAGSLFHYISEAKEIDVWEPGKAQTEFESNYIRFFESLADHYINLKEMLLAKSSAYQGLACRIIAENPFHYLNSIPWKKVIFAGFNALTPAQIIMLKYLVKENKAEIIFDAEEYYLSNPLMEAGLFLRKYQSDKGLGDFKNVTNEFIRKDRNVYTVGIPGNTGQARIAGKILSSIPEDQHHNTAVVLADESMLLPLLNSLPTELNKFNVTMGYPLPQAPLYALADSIFQLHVNAIYGSSGIPSFYHGDVTRALKNNFLTRIIDSSIIKSLINAIKKNNYSYITLSEITALEEAYKQTPDQNNEVSVDENASNILRDETLLVLNILFAKQSSAVSLLSSISRILELLRKTYINEENASTDTEVLYCLYDKIKKLEVCLVSEEIHIESLLTLHNFFREIANGTKVPFYGEPLQGIQIMGMLETRVLDFENIILISVNEDILPSSKSNKSFIPFDIRLQFGLPTHHERQAVFAYHFYHLLQRCNKAWLVYNEDDNKLGGGEKSRLIQQLEWELPSRGLAIKNLNFSENRGSNTAKPIVIRKDESILQRLHEKVSRGISFSSLKKYINCPLSFYYSYVLGLEETEEVEEDISARSIGTILHAILQDLYEPKVGKTQDEMTLLSALKQVESLVAVKTRFHLPELKIDSGRNLLFIKVAETWLRRFLEDELKGIKAASAPVIAGIEYKVIRELSIDVSGLPQVVVSLYGMIDRIDIYKGNLRLIDYKTGKVDDRDLKVESADDLFDPERSMDKQLQLSFYKYIIQSDPISNGIEIMPGIISFRSLGKGFMSLNSNVSTSDFESCLKSLLKEIFNPSIDFYQMDIKHCKFCSYKQICNRTIF